MLEEVTIDAAGRLVIPKAVRVRHRLTAGTRLLLMEEEDRLILVPRASEVSPVGRDSLLIFRGTLASEVADHRELDNERFDRLAGPKNKPGSLL